MKMESPFKHLALLILTLALAEPAHGQTTAFTYQGRLMDGETPASGSFDVRATLHNALVEGTQLADAFTNLAVTVTQGLFTVSWDFGSTFDGRPLWLEIAVRKEGEEAFVPLLPRQAITPTPYALHALSVAPSSVTGLFAGIVAFTNDANAFSGDFAGRFAGTGELLENVNASSLGGLGTNNFWRTDGNTGTDPATNFLGTTDNKRFQIKVNGNTAISLIPERSSSSIVIGSDCVWEDGHLIRSSAILGGHGHTILSGEKITEHCAIGGGYGNTISGHGNNIGGGISNYLRTLTDGSTIGGGRDNFMYAYGRCNVIAGGAGNKVGGRSSELCTISGGGGNTLGGTWGSYGESIGGGGGNSITTGISGQGYSTISGGHNNSIYTGSDAHSIGGGTGNSIRNTDAFTTIAGGNNNSISGFSSRAATISGGSDNIVRNEHGTIAGGRENEVNASLGAILGGANANARLHGQVAQAAGRFESNGDAQASSYICRSVTTNNTETELFLDGSGQRIEVPNNSTWTFDILVTARGTNAASAGYQLRGVIQNNEGVTSFLGSPVATTLAETSYTWDAVVTADEVNKSLAIKVTGDIDTSIRWVASVRTVEVGY